MSQLTSRGLDNTSSAFVSDIYISIYIYISQQSILKQGFQKTHFPTVLEVENFFAVDLANF